MMDQASTCAALKQAWPGTELVAGEQGSHLEDGDGKTALICLCSLERIDAWPRTGQPLVHQSNHGPELSLTNRGRIFATFGA